MTDIIAEKASQCSISSNLRNECSQQAQMSTDNLLTIIAMAITSEPKGYVTFTQILDFVAKAISYDQTRDGWLKNRIEETIKKNENNFIHISENMNRDCMQDGYWTLHPIYASRFVNNFNLNSQNYTNLNEQVDEIDSGKCKYFDVKIKRDASIDHLALKLKGKDDKNKKIVNTAQGFYPPTVNVSTEIWEGFCNQSAVLRKSKQELNKVIKLLSHTFSIVKSSDQKYVNVKNGTTAGVQKTLEQIKNTTVSLKNKENKNLKLDVDKEKVECNLANSRVDIIQEVPDGFVGFDDDQWSGNFRGWDKCLTRQKERFIKFLKGIENSENLEHVLKECEHAVSMSMQVIEMQEMEKETITKKRKRTYDCENNKGPEDLSLLIQQQLKELEQAASPFVEPPFSYTVLIAMALTSTTEPGLSLPKILSFIENKFPYYHTSNISWKTSVEQTLKFNTIFVKACQMSCRKLQEHGGCWTLSISTAAEILERALDVEKKKIDSKRQRRSDAEDTTTSYGNISDSNEEIINKNDESSLLNENETQENMVTKELQEHVVSSNTVNSDLKNILHEDNPQVKTKICNMNNGYEESIYMGVNSKQRKINTINNISTNCNGKPTVTTNILAKHSNCKEYNSPTNTQVHEKHSVQELYKITNTNKMDRSKNGRIDCASFVNTTCLNLEDGHNHIINVLNSSKHPSVVKSTNQINLEKGKGQESCSHLEDDHNHINSALNCSNPSCIVKHSNDKALEKENNCEFGPKSDINNCINKNICQRDISLLEKNVNINVPVEKYSPNLSQVETIIIDDDSLEMNDNEPILKEDISEKSGNVHSKCSLKSSKADLVHNFIEKIVDHSLREHSTEIVNNRYSCSKCRAVFHSEDMLHTHNRQFCDYRKPSEYFSTTDNVESKHVKRISLK